MGVDPGRSEHHELGEVRRTPGRHGYWASHPALLPRRMALSAESATLLGGSGFSARPARRPLATPAEPRPAGAALPGARGGGVDPDRRDARLDRRGVRRRRVRCRAHTRHGGGPQLRARHRARHGPPRRVAAIDASRAGKPRHSPRRRAWPRQAAGTGAHHPELDRIGELDDRHGRLRATATRCGWARRWTTGNGTSTITQRHCRCWRRAR